MTREEKENAIKCLKLWIEREPYLQTYKTCLEALEQESVIDRLDEIITDALDKSTDQKESQTLRWVLDKISEVQNDTENRIRNESIR